MKIVFSRKSILHSVICDLKDYCRLYNKHSELGNYDTAGHFANAINHKIDALIELNIIHYKKCEWLRDITENMRGFYKPDLQ